MNDYNYKVCISCITYNQVGYIRQCLDGFVMQKTNFPFVAIVHDDASTDGTAEIVREYAKMYPEIIEPIIETENQYSNADGSLVRIMDAACQGEYIAMCEGDDYWTDPLKLQKQADFMDAHPEYSMCFHGAYELYPDGKFKKKKGYTQSRDVDVEAIFKDWGLVSTNSIFYRKSVIDFKEFRSWAAGCNVGDGPLQMWLVTHGKVHYEPEIMSVYRVAAKNSFTERNKKNPSALIKNAETNLNWMRKIVDYMPEYSHIIKGMIDGQLIVVLSYKGEYSKIFKDSYMRKCLRKTSWRFQGHCLKRWIFG